MPIANVINVRERDFREFLQSAPREELLRQREALESELRAKFAETRSYLSELMRDRLAVIDNTLGLAA